MTECLKHNSSNSLPYVASRIKVLIFESRAVVQKPQLGVVRDSFTGDAG